MKNRSGHIALYWMVNLCRLALAVTFIFSGFVKAIDPMGMLYKLNAYFVHWGFTFNDDSLLLKFIVTSLATVEFLSGIYLLLGIRRRSTSYLVLFFMLGMTMLTTYVYAYNPVPDCGCFGEAVEISNGATLIKNILLLVAAIIIVPFAPYMKRLISERNQWISSIYSLFYIIALSLLAYHYLPVMDFTPFRNGTDLRASWYGEGNSPEDIPVELQALTLTTADGQEDRTEALLNDTGYTFLVTIPQISTADDGCNDRINDLYDDCHDNGYGIYGIVGNNASQEEINEWIDRTGATYPILKCDPPLLKAMVRSNPGLLLLKDGVIINKWSNNNLPVLSEDRSWSRLAVYETVNLPLIKLLLWFVIPLFVITSIDGIWIGSKFYRHYIFKKKLKTKKS